MMPQHNSACTGAARVRFLWCGPVARVVLVATRDPVTLTFGRLPERGA